MQKMNAEEWSFRLDCVGPLAPTATLRRFLKIAPADAPPELLAELKDELICRAEWEANHAV